MFGGDVMKQLTYVAASIGVAACNGHPDCERIVTDADDALYRAKYNGRNRCELAD